MSNADNFRLGLEFSSEALETDLAVLGIVGREELGQLYRFQLRVASDAGPLTDAALDALLLAHCAFSMGPGEHDVVHGVVRSIDLLIAREGEPAEYQVEVVPTVWLLTISRVSRVFRDMSVVDMARDILERYGLGDKDFLLSPTDGAVREYSIQYEESDWDFLQRWFEHEGYSFWFESSDAGERLIVGETSLVHRPVPGTAVLQYRDRNDLEETASSIFNWRMSQQRLPARVVLKDYDYQNPSRTLLGQAEVDSERGFGVLFSYGEHFTDDQSGKILARKRAERCVCERRTFHGETALSSFRVGHTFEMWNHFSASQNGEYLITAIDHIVGVPYATGDDLAAVTHEVPYRARFEAIPLAVQYRPARSTPWPSIHGVMHGHIDSDTTGEFSTIDKDGRYRVRLPFDGSGNAGEGVSLWIRMAQSYAGAGYGAHYPLHKGAEVVVAFLDGDPDRPVVVGAVPNAHTPSPSVDKNATQSVVRTASGIRLVMEDNLAGSGADQGSGV